MLNLFQHPLIIGTPKQVRGDWFECILTSTYLFSTPKHKNSCITRLIIEVYVLT